MLTQISERRMSSGKLIRIAMVLCRVIILKPSSSGLAKEEVGLLLIQNRLNLRSKMHECDLLFFFIIYLFFPAFPLMTFLNLRKLYRKLDWDSQQLRTLQIINEVEIYSNHCGLCICR